MGSAISGREGTIPPPQHWMGQPKRHRATHKQMFLNSALKSMHPPCDCHAPSSSSSSQSPVHHHPDAQQKKRDAEAVAVKKEKFEAAKQETFKRARTWSLQSAHDVMDLDSSPEKPSAPAEPASSSSCSSFLSCSSRASAS